MASEGKSMSGRRQEDGESVHPPAEEQGVTELRERETRLGALRAKRTDLEVERIVAEVELHAARSGPDAHASGEDAAAIVDALDRLHRIELQLSARRAYAKAGIRSHDDLLERLHAGDEALGAWLDAGRDDSGATGPRIAKQALLAACLVIVALSVAIHVAFLVLLVPVGGAMSFLLWTGQDRAWRRVGARRRFERLRLEPPAAWTERAVSERRDSLSLLAGQVRERASACGDGDIAAEGETRDADPDAARSDLREALAAGGLDESRLDESIEAALRAAARVHRAKQALRDVADEMAEQRDGAGAIRESLYRRLAREGGAAPDGNATVDALEAGLEKARRR